jgi:hypothetical protein
MSSDVVWNAFIRPMTKCIGVAISWYCDWRGWRQLKFARRGLAFPSRWYSMWLFLKVWEMSKSEGHQGLHLFRAYLMQYVTARWIHATVVQKCEFWRQKMTSVRHTVMSKYKSLEKYYERKHLVNTLIISDVSRWRIKQGSESGIKCILGKWIVFV